jgi:4-hydroxy-3-methylbut-2-enyl diphosphate reductase
MRVNDAEGTVMLSKKRLDSVKSVTALKKPSKPKELVEGFVVEENKGGIVVSVSG